MVADVVGGAALGVGVALLVVPAASPDIGSTKVGILSAAVAPAIAEFFRKVRLEVDTSFYPQIFKRRTFVTPARQDHKWKKREITCGVGSAVSKIFRIGSYKMSGSFN